MEITKNIYIDNQRQLHVYVDITEGNSDSVDNGIYITSAQIYNNKSYIDGNPIYNIHVDSNSHKIDEIITDSNIAVMDQVLNESCYPTDLHKSLLIIVLSLEYSVEYQSSHTCAQTPNVLTFAVYYPCTLYTGLLPSINELEQDCTQIPMNFVNGLLRKKAIDACIEAGHFEQACKYWCKFYQHGAATFSSASTNSGGCGCHG